MNKYLKTLSIQTKTKHYIFKLLTHGLLQLLSDSKQLAASSFNKCFCVNCPLHSTSFTKQYAVNAEHIANIRRGLGRPRQLKIHHPFLPDTEPSQSLQRNTNELECRRKATKRKWAWPVDGQCDKMIGRCLVISKYSHIVVA